jgi:hypothetical protein
MLGYFCDVHPWGCVFTDQFGFDRVGRAAPAAIQRAQDEREWRRFWPWPIATGTAGT